MKKLVVIMLYACLPSLWLAAEQLNREPRESSLIKKALQVMRKSGE